MSQKVNPVGFRTGTFLPWKSRWFTSGKKFREFLIEDIRLRRILMSRLKLAGVTDVQIERLPKVMNIELVVSRPGMVIGRGGTGIEELKKYIVAEIGGFSKTSTKDLRIDLRVNEIRNPELSAHLVATRIVSELERRLPHRRVVTKVMDRVMQSGALGVKIVLSGRIGGAEIGRTEKYHRGSVPLQTLRETIDYAQTPALLKRGYVGVKVLIHKKKDKESL